MTLVLNGAAGGWDELAIAVLALGVLWVAVKLAGRKRTEGDNDDDETALDEPAEEQEDQSPASRPRTPPA